MIGKTVAHYEIVERLGAGGMGVVYKARDTRLDRFVALKFLPPHLSADPEIKDRFLREARAASALDHPQICAVHAIEEDDTGQLFLVLAFYEGESLAARIARGPLDPEEARALALQIARGLAAAHEGGILHRDIKPANVFVTPRGEAKILDFGLARVAGGTRITRTGTSLGTLLYMAPEQIRGQEVDHRADLWALGAVLWEMLTGRAPFAGDNEGAVVHAVLDRDPGPPSAHRPEVPPALDAIALRALAKKPAERYASAAELIVDLSGQAGAAGAPVPEPPAAGETALWGTPPAAAPPGALAARETPPHDTSPSAAQAPAADLIAVLDLRNLTGDPEADWLSTGIAESVAADLKRVAALRLADRRQVRAAATALGAGEASETDLAALGRRLGARWVLSGAYQKAGEALRITAELTDVVEGRAAGPESSIKLDGSLAEIFTLQDRLVAALIEALDLEASPSALEEIVRPETLDLEAYELCARGRQLTYEMSPETIEQARGYLERAIELDPSYALAHSSLGQLQAMRYIATTDPGDLERAIKHLERAAALDPELGDAYLWLTYGLSRLDRFDEALAAGRKAVELEPDNALAHYFLGAALAMRWHIGQRPGGWAEGVRHLERVRRLAPRYQPGHQILADCYLRVGLYDEARPCVEAACEIEASGDFELARFVGAHATRGLLALREGDLGAAHRDFERSLALLAEIQHVYTPAFTALSHEGLARVLVRQRRPGEALPTYRRARTVLEENPRSLGSGWILLRVDLGLATAFRALGMAREGQAALDRATRLFTDRRDFDFSWVFDCGEGEILTLFAAVAARSGDPEGALAHLRRAVDRGWLELPRLDRDPAFESLRELPEFGALRQDLATRRAAIIQ